MKTVEFECWIRFNEISGDNWTVVTEVSDKEFKLLKKMRFENQSLSKYKELREFYQKLYNTIVNDLIKQSLENNVVWTDEDLLTIQVELSDEFEMDDFIPFSCSVSIYMDDKKVDTIDAISFYTTKEEAAILTELLNKNITLSQYKGLTEVKNRIKRQFLHEAYLYGENYEISENGKNYRYEFGISFPE